MRLDRPPYRIEPHFHALEPRNSRVRIPQDLTHEMNDMSIQLGYCTNVHAGANLETTRANLQEHATVVKQLFSPDQPMGIGLWLSAPTAMGLQDEKLKAFKDWLDREGLVPFTFNGFPFGDFHQPVVKHKVYEPTWSDKERLEYTSQLFRCMDTLLPEGMDGSISTLPLGWGDLAEDESFLQRCGLHLSRLSEQLESLEESTGRRIQVCLEPEPGCVIDTAEDLTDFFERYLSGDSENQRQRSRRYLGVCHDICHSAVMNESQKHAVDAYQNHGIEIGKVQVSAAVQFELPPFGSANHDQVLQQLEAFAEDRYLHQTTVASQSNPTTRFFEDLPQAIESASRENETTRWRTHFHVPIYRKHLGLMQSTQEEIREFLAALADSNQDVRHFEVETYAWSVLPAEHQVNRLADGISQELHWFHDLYCSGSGRNPNVK